jgi:cell division protein FtsB
LTQAASRSSTSAAARVSACASDAVVRTRTVLRVGMVQLALVRKPLVLFCGLLYRSGVVKKSERRSSKRATPNRSGRTRRIAFGLLMFLALVIAVDGLVGDKGLLTILRARQEYDDLSATVAHERAENAGLRDEARRLRDDPATIEEVARRELGLIKPGEKVFIIKDLAPAQPAKPSNSKP